MPVHHSDTNQKDREELLINGEVSSESPPPSYDELVSQSARDANEVESNANEVESNANEVESNANEVESNANLVVQRVVVYRKRPGPCLRLCSVILSLLFVIVIIIAKASTRREYRVPYLSSDFKSGLSDFKPGLSDFKPDLSDFKPDLTDFKPRLPSFNDMLKSRTWEILRASICYQLPPLTYIEPWKGHEETFVLRVNSSLIPLYTYKKGRSEDLQCCYIPDLFRLSNLQVILRSPCVPFKEMAFLDSTDMILVECKHNGSSSSSKIVYKNIHPVMSKKIVDQGHLSRRISGKTDEQMNVLIFGYDVNSNSSIMKTLPRTVEIMRKKGFIEFENFSKINVSKLSNDLALLKGQSLQLNNENCESYSSEDECRLNPDEFMDAGYLVQKLDCSIILHRDLDSTLDDISSCLQPKFTQDLLFRHLTRSISRLNKYLYYSVSWLFDMTAKNFDDSSFDLRTSQFLIELDQSGLYNNTLVLFITYTEPQKSLSTLATEESNPRNVSPTLYLAVPQWFQRKYPSAMKNLRTNRKKLITPYDVFLTIKEITNKQSFVNMTNCASKKCRSLLHHIENRSCREAGIASSVCPKLQYFD